MNIDAQHPQAPYPFSRIVVVMCPSTVLPENRVAHCGDAKARGGGEGAAGGGVRSLDHTPPLTRQTRASVHVKDTFGECVLDLAPRYGQEALFGALISRLSVV